MDYNFEPTVTFTPGVTTVIFNISIIDDNVTEGNEYFRLFINTETLPLGVLHGHPSSAVVTIIDDDDTEINSSSKLYICCYLHTYEHYQCMASSRQTIV